ncbi:MAG: pyridoxamine 5'-phosphate oxidase family protein [Caulobacteraceae bacterium]|mgnify:CR=1 FL=1
MTTEAEIEEKFWKALKHDRTVMLGLTGVAQDHAQPMTAQIEDDRPEGPIWFFTAKDTDLAQAVAKKQKAGLQLVDKGHDLFATVRGELVQDNDPAVIDRLWNRFVAAWFEGGRDDPKLCLLRFDPVSAQIWLNENSLFAGIKLMLGSDPKQDFKDKTAEVRL